MLKKFSLPLIAIVSTGLLGGCATLPEGPTVAVMPGPGIPLAQFRHDQAVCRAYARQEAGANPNEIAQQQVISGAALGTAIGALGGAVIGGGRSDVTRSMAGAGLFMGSAIGASAAEQSRMTLQRRYNIAYMQCMYTKGNSVPGYPPPRYTPPPPPGSAPPPPPPGKQ